MEIAVDHYFVSNHNRIGPRYQFYQTTKAKQFLLAVFHINLITQQREATTLIDEPYYTDLICDVYLPDIK